VQGVVEISIALTRVESFLRLDELQQPLLPSSPTRPGGSTDGDTDGHKTSVKTANSVAAAFSGAATIVGEAASVEPPPHAAAIALAATDMSFCWPDTIDRSVGKGGGPAASPVLFSGVNLEVRQGELVCITGDVGVGKTTLLMVLASQLRCASGAVITGVKNSRVYCPQTPWVFTGSIRENIYVKAGRNNEAGGNKHVVTQEEAEEERYQKILRSCCLTKDIEGMPDGDKTIVGEQGVTLSGGQKQRLSVARGLFASGCFAPISRGDQILLLDDPFSALDSSTHAALMNTMDECAHQQQVAVVLVTHQLQHASKSADRVLELMSGGELHERKAARICEAKQSVAAKVSEIAPSLPDSGSVGEREQALAVTKEGHSAPTVAMRLYADEAMGSGGIGLSLYRRYVLAGGSSAGLALSLFLLVVCEAVVCWVTVIVAKALESASVTTSVLSLCWWLMALVMVFCIIASALFHIRLSFASEMLHAKMLNAVIASPISSFFDITPLGRILNRFSKDIGLMDQELPITMFDCTYLACLYFYTSSCIRR
jgi:ABC-type multidrug transport system fused ATPase/permease subunit